MTLTSLHFIFTGQFPLPLWQTRRRYKRFLYRSNIYY